MSEESKSTKKTKRKSLSKIQIWELIKKTFQEYFTEASFRHAAALAYYTIFSVIPMVYLGVYFFGRFLGNEMAQDLIYEFLHNTVGMEDVSGIMNYLDQFDITKRNKVMEIVGFVTLLFTSSAFVVTLQKSINDFLDIDAVDIPVKRKILQTVISRLVAIGFIGILGIVIIIVYIAQTILLSLGKELITNSTMHFLFNNGLAHFASIATNFIVFTMLFKFVHDGIVRWKSAMFGALITAVLVYLGQILIKYYLTHFFFAADGGVVGSLFAFLAWIFYTGQIIFLGAKFVKVYSDVVGTPVISRYLEIKSNGKTVVVNQEDGTIVAQEEEEETTTID